MDSGALHFVGPCVTVFGSARPFREMLDRMASAGTISRGDRDLMLVTDDLNEAERHIRAHAIERFGLRPACRPWPLLGEPKALTS